MGDSGGFRVDLTTIVVVDPEKRKKYLNWNELIVGPDVILSVVKGTCSKPFTCMINTYEREKEYFRRVDIDVSVVYLAGPHR